MAEATKRRRWTRRAAIVGGGLAVVGGAAVRASRKGDKGGAHDRYFANLSAALRRAGIAHPVLVVDRARLEKYLDEVREVERRIQRIEAQNSSGEVRE